MVIIVKGLHLTL